MDKQRVIDLSMLMGLRLKEIFDKREQLEIVAAQLSRDDMFGKLIIALDRGDIVVVHKHDDGTEIYVAEKKS
jgi:hypothetical protein